VCVLRILDASISGVRMRINKLEMWSIIQGFEWHRLPAFG